eukprot:3341998-Amphidinium_carterae.1
MDFASHKPSCKTDHVRIARRLSTANQSMTPCTRATEEKNGGARRDFTLEFFTPLCKPVLSSSNLCWRAALDASMSCRHVCSMCGRRDELARGTTLPVPKHQVEVLLS